MKYFRTNRAKCIGELEKHGRSEAQGWRLCPVRRRIPHQAQLRPRKGKPLTLHPSVAGGHVSNFQLEILRNMKVVLVRRQKQRSTLQRHRRYQRIHARCLNSIGTADVHHPRSLKVVGGSDNAASDTSCVGGTVAVGKGPAVALDLQQHV